MGYNAAGYRIYADGVEFGKDYQFKEQAQKVARVFREHHPIVRYSVRAIPRCTSRNPAVGYMRCEKPRNHAGVCETGGYRWYRGRGHARPFLVARPKWDQ